MNELTAQDLESVEYRKWFTFAPLASLLSTSFFGLMLLWVVGVLIIRGRPLTVEVAKVLGMVTLMALLGALPYLRRSPLVDIYWKTSKEGLTCRSLFHERFTAWEKVTKARTLWLGLFDGTRHKIWVGRLVALVPQDPRLEASLWQYLHEYGKADNIEVSDEALLLLRNLPDKPFDAL